MRTGLFLILPLSAVLWAGLFTGCRTATPFSASQRESTAEAIISKWSQSSRLAAYAMIELYGAPDALAANGLGWKNKGRWMRIVVWDRVERRGSERGGADRLVQTVAYLVPEGKRGEIEDFSEHVRVAPDGRSLSAGSDTEALNFLALNLADEIGRGVIDAERARYSYKRAVDLARAGKTSEKMTGILFPASY